MGCRLVTATTLAGKPPVAPAGIAGKDFSRMGFSVQEQAECDRILQWGLAEDLGEAGDITSSATIPADARGSALVVARQIGYVAGLPALPRLAALRNDGLTVELLAEDGPVVEDQPVARLAGTLRSVLSSERLALNLLSRLSGVATLTSSYVHAVRGTKAKICDTRKTTPGLRYLEKYAVRVGGGTNHRVGLFDAVLIKDNHLAGLAVHEQHPIRVAVERARAAVQAGTIVQVEVDSLVQLEEALASKPDLILLDNMTAENLSLAVEMRDLRGPGIGLEASGGITLTTIGAIARSGVERISVGALTHSAPALDLGLDYES